MKTTHRDEDFECQNCHMMVPRRGGGYCRNHCPNCLYSYHVDLKLPGDRKCTCQSLMKPVDMIYNSAKKTYQIIHECLKCKYRHPVTVAKDDSKELIYKLTKEFAERKMMEL